MFEPIRIELLHPVMHGDEEIKELVFGREMVAGDLRDISVKDMTHDNIVTVAGRICGVPDSVLRKLKMPDYLRLSDVIGGFFGDSPATGPKL